VYFKVNFNVFFKLIKVHLLVTELYIYRVTQKKWELLKNPTKIEEIQEKKFIDRN